MNINPPVFAGFINDRFVLLCNARALHEHMKVPSEFSKWILRRINTYGLVENLDYYKFSSTEDPNKKSPIVIKPEDLKKHVPASQKSDSGNPQVDYLITTIVAKQLALVEHSIDFRPLAETMEKLSVDDLGNIYFNGYSIRSLDLKSNEDSQAVKNPDVVTVTVPLSLGEFNGEEQLLCNARKLHERLQVGRDFSTWIKGRIEEYGFVENQDYILVFPQTGENSPKGGRPSIEYHLTLDMAKELAMVEKTEVGRQVRKYFIQCEKDAQKVLHGTGSAAKTELPDPLFAYTYYNVLRSIQWGYRMLDDYLEKTQEKHYFYENGRFEADGSERSMIWEFTEEINDIFTKTLAFLERNLPKIKDKKMKIKIEKLAYILFERGQVHHHLFERANLPK